MNSVLGGTLSDGTFISIWNSSFTDSAVHVLNAAHADVFTLAVPKGDTVGAFALMPDHSVVRWTPTHRVLRGWLSGKHLGHHLLLHDAAGR